MTAFNVVRFKVKPGMEDAFLDAHRKVAAGWPGMLHANIIKSGDSACCVIADWESMEALAAALTDLGGGLGLTDPVSGSVVLSML